MDVLTDLPDSGGDRAPSEGEGPGADDHRYRQRRRAIAAAAEAYRPGEPVPDVEYTPEEDGVWRLVSSHLAEKHRRLACREYLEGAARLRLPAHRVPQLREVDERVSAITGFRLRPVAGLVPPRQFYGSLADRTFMSTQYIRHHSTPLYTPEPDIVHEIIGHANSLASPLFADLYQKAGAASLRARDEAALGFFSRVWWFTMEFGVVHEDDGLRAYGAGLLSSYGEIDHFRRAEIRPWDIAAMGRTEYDITRYQPVLFAAPSLAEAMAELGRFFDRYDDAFYHSRLAA
ncbi:MAG TPA: phenylalanine 4-monooxygenase [Acidimicrobiales bacterium]|nr:phenylalanine 4-monooxygenase [Acidimicrobiales bacterium]